MDEQIHLNRRVHRKTIIRYTAHEPIINNPEMKVERTKEENIQKCYPEYWCIMVFVVCAFGVRLSISPLVCGVCARLKLADDNRVEREKKIGRGKRAWTKYFSNVVLDAIRKLVRCTTHPGINEFDVMRQLIGRHCCSALAMSTEIRGSFTILAQSTLLYSQREAFVFFFLFLLLFWRCLCTRTINNPSVKSAWISLSLLMLLSATRMLLSMPFLSHTMHLRCRQISTHW